MKKAKIMLMAITVLAVVGGALAFKAKTVDTVRVCATTTNDNSGICKLLPSTFAQVGHFTTDLTYSPIATTIVDALSDDASCQQFQDDCNIVSSFNVDAD